MRGAGVSTPFQGGGTVELAAAIDAEAGLKEGGGMEGLLQREPDGYSDYREYESPMAETVLGFKVQLFLDSLVKTV